MGRVAIHGTRRRARSVCQQAVGRNVSIRLRRRNSGKTVSHSGEVNLVNESRCIRRVCPQQQGCIPGGCLRFRRSVSDPGRYLVHLAREKYSESKRSKYKPYREAWKLLTGGETADQVEPIPMTGSHPLQTEKPLI